MQHLILNIATVFIFVRTNLKKWDHGADLAVSLLITPPSELGLFEGWCWGWSGGGGSHGEGHYGSSCSVTRQPCKHCVR